MIKKILTKCTSTQKRLARWASWFFLANAVLWILVATNYLSLLPKFAHIEALGWRGELLSYVFIASTFIGYFSFIAYCAWILVAVLSWYWHRYWVIFLSITLGLSISVLLVIDSVVYHLFHFHFWGIVWSILRAGVAEDVLILSVREWLIVGILVVFLLILELIIAFIVWRLTERHARIKHTDSIAYVILGALFLSYALLIEAYASVDRKAEVVVSTHLISLEAQLIPFYNSLMGLLLPEKEGVLKLETRGGGAFLQLQQVAKPLAYPLHSLRCKKPTKPYNILIIMVDALRYESLNARVMPHLTQFAQNSWQFEKHYSGGNATGPGVFSLFYGLPYNYWTSMLKQHRGPVLIDRLQALNYEMGIYRSAAMHYPAFDETVFVAIKNLQLSTPGHKAYLRDEAITQEFKHFLSVRDPKRPFFGFLFYDALHNYCERNTAYAQIFQPAIAVCNRAHLDEDSDPVPYLNRYYNAAHFIDTLIAQILADLKRKNLLDNTILLISSDHGEEFNESQQNYWGHVSAYTDWQLHVPFILYWPKHTPKQIDYETSHYDVAPYLMQDILGCDNPAQDYSTGFPLLQPAPRSYFLANSYIDYAILNSNTVTRIYPQGNYVISDRAANDKLDAQLDREQLQQVFQELHRYFQSE